MHVWHAAPTADMFRFVSFLGTSTCLSTWLCIFRLRLCSVVMITCSMFFFVFWIPLTCSMLSNDLLSISQYSNALAPSSEDLILAKVVAVRLRQLDVSVYNKYLNDLVNFFAKSIPAGYLL